MSNSGAGVETSPIQAVSLSPEQRRLIKRQTIYRGAFARHGGGGWCEEDQKDNCEKAQFLRHVMHELKTNEGVPLPHDESCPCALPDAVPGQAEAVA